MDENLTSNFFPDQRGRSKASVLAFSIDIFFGDAVGDLPLFGAFVANVSVGVCGLMLFWNTSV